VVAIPRRQRTSSAAVQVYLPSTSGSAAHIRRVNNFPVATNYVLTNIDSSENQTMKYSQNNMLCINGSISPVAVPICRAIHLRQRLTQVQGKEVERKHGLSCCIAKQGRFRVDLQTKNKLTDNVVSVCGWGDNRWPPSSVIASATVTSSIVVYGGPGSSASSSSLSFGSLGVWMVAFNLLVFCLIKSIIYADAYCGSIRWFQMEMVQR
ncbi:hypothetical protein EJB05_48930, partial [Eragrostis curvula]